MNPADAQGAMSTDSSGMTDPDGTSAQICTDASSPLGAVTDYALGTWSLNQDDQNNPVIVGHDSDGIFVFSALCTHERCVVNDPAANGNTYCACHGSRFDGNGNVISGPARRPLAHFAVTVCNGMVSYTPSQHVAAATRIPV